MIKKSRATVKVAKEMQDRLRDIMRERIEKNLSPCNARTLGVPHATELVLRCPSWKLLEKEMRTLPERRKKKKNEK